MKNPNRYCLVYLLLVTGLVAVVNARAQSQTPVIEPQVDRRDISIPRIDATDLEIGAYVGILSVEDFGANSSSGFRIGYHVTEDFFLEGTYGRSSISDQSFYDLGIPIFTKRQLDLTYYHASIGCNLFPGEIFLGRDWALTSAVYVIGGLGNVNFADEDHTTYNFGFGIRVLPADWLSLRLEVRDYVFESDLLGKNEFKHNFEMSFGLGAYF